MFATVKMIEEMLAELAPVETAESYDNVGALVGSRGAEVTKWRFLRRSRFINAE